VAVGLPPADKTVAKVWKEQVSTRRLVAGSTWCKKFNPQNWKLRLRQPKDPSEAAAKKGKINHLVTPMGNIFS
jgi:hypothetical protein